MSDENLVVSKKVLEKIQKLMALARGGANVNESANAFAHAQALLMKHRISMAEVELAATAFKQPDENIVEGTKPLYSGQRIIHWKSSLGDNLARLNHCSMFYYNYRNPKSIKYLLVGRPSDMEIVHYMFESIVVQIERLCKDTMKAGFGEGKTWSNNFKHGAVETVIKRLREENQKVRDEYKGTAALVFVDRRGVEVTEWIAKNMKLGKTQNTNVARQDQSARDMGRAAGNRVSLNKGIGGGGSRGGGFLT